MKKRILYLSHVDWNWIKQRPHFIAEELSKLYEVQVLYNMSFRKKQLQKRENTINAKRIYRIPFISRYKVLANINVWLGRRLIRRELKRKTDYIYLTAPWQIHMIKEISDVKVIYDCMDDHVALARYNVKSCEPDERALVNRADYILVSSEKLKENLLYRYGNSILDKITIVRNAYGGNIQTKHEDILNKDRFTIAYFGTVSSWFDFDVIKQSLEEIENLYYKIIGPIDTDILKHERIDYLGTIEHESLYKEIKDADCLVMPFKLNSIVEAVDPVKIYEYINFRKNILMVEYPEVKRFEKFVHFYQDKSTYLAQIRKMISSRTLTYSEEARVEFLKNNTWRSRVDVIHELIK